MGIEKTILAVFVVALIAVALIGVTALTSVNNSSSNPALSKHTESENEANDKEDVIPSDFSAKITMEQAQGIALNNVVGGTIKDGSLENENGNIVYNIDVITDTTETEVKISPNDGTVLKIQSDNNDKERDNEDDKDDINEQDSEDSESD